LVLLGTVGGPEYLVTYPNGHQVSYVTSVYRVTHRPADTDRIVADGVEVTALGWHQLTGLTGLIGLIGSSSTEALDLSDADGAAPTPDPALFGLFVRSLLAEFGALL
jgi:hypothetical protein